MKKTFLGIFAVAALSFTLTSCGEKLLTPEQVKAEVDKGFTAGKAAVETDEAAKCEARKEQAVNDEVERMKAEAEAAKAAEEAAAKPAAKASRK